MIELKNPMNREQKLSLLKDSWFSLENQFKITPQLNESFEHRNGQSKGYDPKSPIRKFGAEPYLQATLFAEINRRQPNSDNFVLGVEGKEFNSKRPDILAWDPKSGQKNPYFVIELKVVASALFRKSLFKNDMEKYRDNEILKNDKPLFFFGCYYEGNPTDILSIKENYGSVLNWAINEKNLDVSQKFKKSVVEGYAFRGDYKWEVIDNSVI